MLKLQDFSKQQGVTDRQVQRLLKKYEKHLQGQFERRGSNGTWLSDEACDFLRSKMKQQPVVVFEDDPRVATLEERVRELEARIDDKEKMLAVAQEQVQTAQGRVSELLEARDRVARLEADNEAAIKRARAAEQRADQTADDLQRAKQAIEDKDLKLEAASRDVIAAQKQAAELQLRLDELANAKIWRRRKLLKELKKGRE